MFPPDINSNEPPPSPSPLPPPPQATGSQSDRLLGTIQHIQCTFKTQERPLLQKHHQNLILVQSVTVLC